MNACLSWLYFLLVRLSSVCLSLCFLSVPRSVWLSVCRTAYLTDLSVLSVSSVCLSVCLYVYMSLCMPVYMYICLFFLSISLSVCLRMRVSVLSVCLCVCMYMCTWPGRKNAYKHTQHTNNGLCINTDSQIHKHIQSHI